ncbi:MAG: PPOX class F420-dependent oxidoreductase [Acidimicrobiales bacterium]
MGIADENYVALTTFRKNGERKDTPIWIADLGDGTIGFTTSKDSWKVKRIGNDPRVELQPSNGRGNPRAGSDVATGKAEVVHGASVDEVAAEIKAKYGFQVALIGTFAAVRKLLGKGSANDAAVIITLD